MSKLRATVEKPGTIDRSERISASNRTPRFINRNLIFNLIRKNQPITRASLSRLTGLRRSTVSLIIEELLEESWLIEGVLGEAGRGRKPITLHFSDRRAVIGMDIHPTQTTIALADLTGRSIAQELIPITPDSEDSIAAIVAGIQSLTRAHAGLSIVGVGVCLPGRTDPANQTMVFAPRLRWPDIDLKARIEQATGLPVEMDNVANACALAEVFFGDSEANGGLVVVNVSEGIAVGMFMNGGILRGYKGMAGEMGHVQLREQEGVLCACGNHGCWETLASNTAALRYHQELAGDHAAPTFDLLLRLALAGQSAAVTALTRAAEELGRGIRILLSGLAPQEIVIVGDIARAWAVVGAVIEREIGRNTMTPPATLRYKHGDDDARIRGAVALILSRSWV